MPATVAEHPTRPAIRRRDRRAAAPVLVAGAVLLAVVLLVHGFLPGLVNDGPWDYLIEGDMRCLKEMGTEALRSWCDWYGLPQGYPFFSSAPVVYAGWALMYGTGMGSYPAYLIANGLFDAIALAGGYGLMRLLGTGRAIALGGSFAYLVSPTVVGLGGFGGTFTGYALLPAYAFADLLAMRLLASGRPRRLVVAVIAGYAAVRTGALFMDGYSFVVSALLSAFLWLHWLLREAPTARRRVLGAAVFAGANAVAYLLYTAYTPAFPEPVPVAFFRSMGLDLVTLVAPDARVWIPHALGLASDHSDLWGDGTNTYNYAGFACLALAAVAVATRLRDRYVAAIAAAGLVALVLSLGPSLKIDDARAAKPAQPTFQSYLMPEGEATADLPWANAFVDLPGLQDMRGIYRWSGLTRLALIVLAGLAIDRLARRRRRVLAGVLAAVALAEIAPDLPALHDTYRAHHADRTAFDAQVVTDMRAATDRGERVLFLSPDGSYIDYLANYLAASMEVRAFNAGGDKNAGFAMSAWPAPVAAIARPGRTADQVADALAQGAPSVVVAPYFHLRWSSYAWPPPPADRAAARRTFAPLVDDPRFEVRRYPWFATLRLR